MTITFQIYVGVDVSKDSLKVARLGKGPTGQFANKKAGMTKLVRQLKLWQPTLIVAEATEGISSLFVCLPWLDCSVIYK